jgi:hypothetical protein
MTDRSMMLFGPAMVQSMLRARAAFSSRLLRLHQCWSTTTVTYGRNWAVEMNHSRRSEPLNFLSRLFLIALSDLGRCVRAQKNEEEYDRQRVHRNTAQMPSLLCSFPAASAIGMKAPGPVGTCAPMACGRSTCRAVKPVIVHARRRDGISFGYGLGGATYFLGSSSLSNCRVSVDERARLRKSSGISAASSGLTGWPSAKCDARPSLFSAASSRAWASDAASMMTTSPPWNESHHIACQPLARPVLHNSTSV